MPTAARLIELFLYDPRTGDVTRRVSRGKGRAGTKVGTAHSAGYLQVRVDGVWAYVHRVAYVLMTGQYPVEGVDHKNGNPADNRWCNLRAATHAENMQNRKKATHNTNPYKGVRKASTDGKWSARIVVDKHEQHLGTFSSAQAAYAAYRKAATQHHPFNTVR